MNLSQGLIESILSLGQVSRTTLALLQTSRSRINESESLQALAILDALANVRVSKLSYFKDDVWDFNKDNPNVSRLLRGFRLLIDFSRYKNIPAAVLLELKCAALLYSQAPSVLMVAEANKKKASKVLKAQTVTSVVDRGLKFVDHLYSVLREDLGDEYIERSLQSLSYVPSFYYTQAAEGFEFAYDQLVEGFFKVLQSLALQGTLFPKYMPVVDFDQLPWLHLGNNKKPESQRISKANKVLPNKIFEHGSSIASMVVVDFLDALEIPVVDKSMLDIRNSKMFFQSRDNHLTQTKLNVYMAIRLFSAGYSREYIKKMWPEGADVLDDLLSNSHRTVLRKKCSDWVGSTFGTEFRKYVNYVSYSCMYLISQYTGMRPSELVRLVADTCLKEDKEDGCWLIESRVEKHQENLVGLFDDYWVAIPIVRDAISACIIISKIKQNPYVFSNVDTVYPGKVAEPLSATGFRSPTVAFLQGFMSPEELDELGFYPYMLRHTLAYQLYRADLGLPFISHQLKHFGEMVGRPEMGRGFSKTTLAYGEIGDMLAKGGDRKQKNEIKHLAELECVKTMYNPNGHYAGANAAEHKAALLKEFSGYMAAGYTEEEVYEAMTEQHVAVINIGQGFCYGGRREEHDASLPCIGGLRCNPNRCANSIVTEAHVPAWINVYKQNRKSLSDPNLQHSSEHYLAAMEEARMVLRKLGVEVDDE